MPEVRMPEAEKICPCQLCGESTWETDLKLIEGLFICPLCQIEMEALDAIRKQQKEHG